MNKKNKNKTNLMMIVMKINNKTNLINNKNINKIIFNKINKKLDK